MGLTKTEQYTKKQVELSMLLKAIAHPARIAILESIINAKACICGDLVTEIGLAQSTVSQHLKELKSAGLIKGSVEGTSMCYCANQKVLNGFKDKLVNLLNNVESNDNCC